MQNYILTIDVTRNSMSLILYYSYVNVHWIMQIFTYLGSGFLIHTIHIIQHILLG